MLRYLLVAALLLVCGPTSAAATLYAARGQAGVSDLFILDQANGAISSTVGPIGFAVTGMDQHPTTGVLYGVTSSNSSNCSRCLITINVTTGAGTAIGPYSIGNGISDIAFSPSGVLFGHSRNQGYYTLNLTTGAATLVGASVTGPAGTDFDSSGTLWLVTGASRYTINTSTGAATLIGPLSPTFGGIQAAKFDPASGVLYARDGQVTLRTINIATGATTFVGSSGSNLDAMAFYAPLVVVVPTVSEWGLLLLALLVTGVGYFALRTRSRFRSG